MKFICILDRFLFLTYTKDVTFIWVEAHEPILFLLKVSGIIESLASLKE